ncbi:DUF3040 domain-containing protein [Micrococcus sp.]|uniref:DUF3040 domain-containing protein n=1 Tax=Micrococcus sp. TaxID=1271 RepID=UPI002A918D3E|nr:DUF3040 domain-containing protein [Micrococcus sp.]MDY6055572.1 DUF3040 domain-containing protein [Micrococcus sp.]
MPLSEREQKMLDDLERQLHAEDPRLATQMRSQTPGRVPVGRIVLGVALALAGLAVVLVGVSTHLLIVGVLGVLVLGAGVFVLTSGARTPQAPAAAGSAAPRPGCSGDSFMARLERDWDERNRPQR